MKKRLLSVLLCAVMLASMIPAAFAASDIENHWAKKYISYLHEQEIYFPKKNTSTYEPNRQMTRAEFMRYINRAFHFTEKASISYADVKPTAWYYETVQIAAKYGYINGVGNNKMDPDGTLTREQAAVIIGRLLKADPGTVSPYELKFTDKSQVSKWSAGYIKAAVDKGILAGYKDGSFKPGRVVTRGEVAKILYYYLGTPLSVAGKTYTGADLKTDTENVTISEGCTLSNATVKGDLYITEGVGAAAVTLNNVKVEGAIIVSGGTVLLNDTTSDRMIVSSPMNRLLDVTAVGATQIERTEVASAATLSEKTLSVGSGGLTAVTAGGKSRVSFTLDAEVAELLLSGEATVSTTASTVVETLTAAKAASVTGYGTIFQADIKASGVSFAKSVSVASYTLAPGISATIGGQTVDTSSASGVSPDRIDIDLGKLSSVSGNVAVTLPDGVRAEKVACDGQTLSPSSEYMESSTGIRLLISYLRTLERGSHTLILTLSDGTQAGVIITVTDSSAATSATSLTFDRYYKSTDFNHLAVRVEGVSKENDIADVVLGMDQLDFDFDNTLRALVLRRGMLAQLREGTYTITVDLASGKQETIELKVKDSVPSGETVYVAEYDTYAPTEPSFSLPLERLTVRAVTARKDNAELKAGTDYILGAHTLTLTKKLLEKYRLSNDYTEFTVTMSDNSVYTLVMDYII